MAGQRYNTALVKDGPDNEGQFTHPVVVTFNNATGYLSATHPTPLYMCPATPTYNNDGNVGSNVPSSGYTQKIVGVWLVSDTANLASAAVDISFDVWRAGAQVGGARFAGFTSNNPAGAIGVPMKVPFDTANTSLAAVAGQAATATKAFMFLKPLDVIVGYATTAPAGVFLAAVFDIR